MESLCLVAILCGLFAIGCLCAGVHEGAGDGGESDVGQRRGIGTMLVHAVVEEGCTLEDAVKTTEMIDAITQACDAHG